MWYFMALCGVSLFSWFWRVLAADKNNLTHKNPESAGTCNRSPLSDETDKQTQLHALTPVAVWFQVSTAWLAHSCTIMSDTKTLFVIHLGVLGFGFCGLWKFPEV